MQQSRCDCRHGLEGHWLELRWDPESSVWCCASRKHSLGVQGAAVFGFWGRDGRTSQHSLARKTYWPVCVYFTLYTPPVSARQWRAATSSRQLSICGPKSCPYKWRKPSLEWKIQNICIREIAETLEVTKSIIWYFHQKKECTGELSNTQSPGIPWKTTKLNDCNILCLVKKNSFTTSAKSRTL